MKETKEPKNGQKVKGLPLLFAGPARKGVYTEKRCTEKESGSASYT
jgi:hypothetical protein